MAPSKALGDAASAGSNPLHGVQDEDDLTEEGYAERGDALGGGAGQNIDALDILLHQQTADLMEIDSASHPANAATHSGHDEEGEVLGSDDGDELTGDRSSRNRRARDRRRRDPVPDDAEDDLGELVVQDEDENELDEENDDDGSADPASSTRYTELSDEAPSYTARTSAGLKPSNPSDANSPFGASGDAADSKYIIDVHPELAAEYEAAGKANRTPVEDIRIDSAAVATWCCPKCGVPWRCGVFVRCTLKNGCPTCTDAQHPSVAVKRPDLVPLWDTSRNDPFLTPADCPADSTQTAHWLCPTCGDSFTARVKDRVMNKSLCPSCAMLHMQSAAVLAQEESALLQEWHPLKNGDLRLDQVQPTDTKTKLWWLCSLCGHDWEATLASRLSRKRRAKGSVCPVCHGKGAANL